MLTKKSFTKNGWYFYTISLFYGNKLHGYFFDFWYLAKNTQKCNRNDKIKSWINRDEFLTKRNASLECSNKSRVFQHSIFFSSLWGPKQLSKVWEILVKFQTLHKQNLDHFFFISTFKKNRCFTLYSCMVVLKGALQLSRREFYANLLLKKI